MTAVAHRPQTTADAANTVEPADPAKPPADPIAELDRSIANLVHQRRRLAAARARQRIAAGTPMRCSTEEIDAVRIYTKVLGSPLGPELTALVLTTRIAA